MSQGRTTVQGVSENDEELEEILEEIDDENIDDLEEEDEPTDETTKETVARILQEAKAEASRSDAKKAEESSTDQRGEQITEKSEDKKEPSVELPPPARFTAEEKQIYNKLPADIKTAVHKMVQNHEATFTKAMISAREKEKEAKHIIEVVRPYLLSHPELQEQGFTESKIVAALLATHQKLKDPSTAYATWLELGKHVGVPEQALAVLAENGQNQSIPDITTHPQFLALQQEVNQLKSERDQATQAQFAQAVDNVTAELAAVREEKDAQGNYLYPELHDPDFLTQAKPLVSTLVQTIPGIGYGDALKRAYFIIKGQFDQSGNLDQANNARLPNNTKERARAAAVSVRGKQNAPMDMNNEINDIPKEALVDTRSSVAWALKQLRGR